MEWTRFTAVKAVLFSLVCLLGINSIGFAYFTLKVKPELYQRYGSTVDLQFVRYPEELSVSGKGRDISVGSMSLCLSDEGSVYVVNYHSNHAEISNSNKTIYIPNYDSLGSRLDSVPDKRRKVLSNTEHIITPQQISIVDPIWVTLKKISYLKEKCLEYGVQSSNGVLIDGEGREARVFENQGKWIVDVYSEFYTQTFIISYKDTPSKNDVLKGVYEIVAGLKNEPTRQPK